MSSMLDPEVKPSPAREIVHKGKGCLAVIVAAAVLVFGGYFVWDQATSFVVHASARCRTTPDPGKAKVTVDVPDRLLAGRDRRHPGRRRTWSSRPRPGTRRSAPRSGRRPSRRAAT